MSSWQNRYGALFAGIAALVCSVLANLGPSATNSSAHPPSAAYLDGPYHPNYREVNYWFDDSFPGEPCTACGPNSKKRAIIRGANAWNDLNQSLHFVEHTNEEVAVSDWYGYCEDPNELTNDGDDSPIQFRFGQPMGIIFWGEITADISGIDFAATGVAKTCDHTFAPGQAPQLWTFKQMYNSDYAAEWYSGRGTGVESYEIDLQSVAAHEFGHSTGWYPHYDYSSDGEELPGTQNCSGLHRYRWTMCAKSNFGDSWWRTLQKDDKHTFGNAY